MDLMDSRIWILGIVAVLAVLALAVWLRSRRKHAPYRMEQGFGPEYGHAVDERGRRVKGP